MRGYLKMVKLITKFKKNRGNGGLSGTTEETYFRNVAEAKRHKDFLRGSYVSSVIVARKVRKRSSSPFGLNFKIPRF